MSSKFVPFQTPLLILVIFWPTQGCSNHLFENQIKSNQIMRQQDIFKSNQIYLLNKYISIQIKSNQCSCTISSNQIKSSTINQLSNQIKSNHMRLLQKAMSNQIKLKILKQISNQIKSNLVIIEPISNQIKSLFQWKFFKSNQSIDL